MELYFKKMIEKEVVVMIICLAVIVGLISLSIALWNIGGGVLFLCIILPLFTIGGIPLFQLKPKDIQKNQENRLRNKLQRKDDYNGSAELLQKDFDDHQRQLELEAYLERSFLKLEEEKRAREELERELRQLDEMKVRNEELQRNQGQRNVNILRNIQNIPLFTQQNTPPEIPKTVSLEVKKLILLEPFFDKSLKSSYFTVPAT